MRGFNIGDRVVRTEGLYQVSGFSEFIRDNNLDPNKLFVTSVIYRRSGLEFITINNTTEKWDSFSFYLHKDVCLNNITPNYIKDLRSHFGVTTNKELQGHLEFALDLINNIGN